MKQTICIALLFLALLSSSCTSQAKSSTVKQLEAKKTVPAVTKALEASKYDAFDITSNGFLDSAGNMWFTTLTEGIFLYDGTTFTNFTEEDGLCDNYVDTVIEDKEGVLWFGTASGLCRYDGNAFATIPIPRDALRSGWPSRKNPEVDPIGVSSLIQDKNGDFWIGSSGSGVYRYDGQTFTSFLKEKGRIMPGGLHHNVISSILEDDAGNIWFSSFSGGGITKYDGNTFTEYGMNNGLGDDMISSSYKDRSGNLWFGTRAGGFSFYDGETFTTFHHTEEPCENFMPSIFEDHTGQYWVASFDSPGICWFDGKNYRETGIKNSELIKNTSFITEDKEGHIWFGGRFGMLWRFDGEVLKDFTNEKEVR